MSKILKNVAGVAPIVIPDVGIDVPIAGYTIPPLEYSDWASSNDIIVQVSSGAIIINDGSVDLSISDGIDLLKGIFPKDIILKGNTSKTLIGNVADSIKTHITNPVITILQGVGLINGRLKVDVEVSNSSSFAAAPVYSNKFKSIFNPINLPLLPIFDPAATVGTTGYSTIYEYIGSGKLDSFFISFSSKNVMVKVTLDDTEILMENDGDLLEHFFQDSSPLYTHGALYWNSDHAEKIIFNPKFPILFGTKIKIEASANSSSTSKVAENFGICLTKET